MTVIYPGSFDPLTDGHFNIICRAAHLFERVLVAVGHNPNKRTMFSAQERVLIIRAATEHLPTVRVDSFSHELLVSYAQRHGIRAIVKGLRNVADFQNEFQQFNMNLALAPELETVFLLADSKELFVSSSLVRDMIRQNSENYTVFVPTNIVQALERFGE